MRKGERYQGQRKARNCIVHVVGARPNFMKIAPLMHAIERYRNVSQYLLHTGQHYDEGLSHSFFVDLDLPHPDIYLGVGSGSHAVQTARIMVSLERIFTARRPDLVVVVGDVNSTLAAALVTAKLNIPLAHVEAGLRSGDLTMPEEVNRIITDRFSALLFTPSEEAGVNLRAEGIPAERIHFVGNIMIDSLRRHLKAARMSPILPALSLCRRAPGGMRRGPVRPYGVVTLHRPSNVDEPQRLRGLLTVLGRIGSGIPLLFPAHPRTVSSIRRFRLGHLIGRVPSGGPIPEGGLLLLPPLGYIDFLELMRHARVILTDSGGIQEESSILGVPCLTLRSRTERPITVRMGTNQLVGTDPERIVRAASRALKRPRPIPARFPLWDGRTALRIAPIIRRFLAAGGGR